MKRIFIILFLFIPISLIELYPQYTSVGGLINDVNTLAARNSNNTLVYTNVDGNPYYSKEFKDCIIYLNDGRYGTIPIRYDLFLDEIEFKKDGKTLWLTKNDIKNIHYGSEILIVTSVSEDAGKLGYVFLQDSGKYSLFMKKAVEYLPYVAPKGYADPIPDRFNSKTDEFYLKIENNPLKKFRTKKDLLGLLGNKPEIEAYIKKEKIKTDKAADLKKLFGYLNSSQL